MIKRWVKMFKVWRLNNQLKECSNNMSLITDYSYGDYKKDVDVIINQIQEIGYE